MKNDPAALLELAAKIEALMTTRRNARTERFIDLWTREIGLLVCGHPEEILGALRALAEGETK